MKDVILRNSRSEQYLCAARKNFREENGVLSESHSKTVICHFSDLHGDWERFENVLSMMEYYRPAFAVHTGDLVCWDSNDEYEEFYREIKECDIPVYNCIGNHETFRGEETLKNEFLHERYISPLRNVNTTGKGYYYTDFDRLKLRLIVLNVYDNDASEKRDDRGIYEISEEQSTWLAETLKACEKEEYGVIIAAHEAAMSRLSREATTSDFVSVPNLTRGVFRRNEKIISLPIWSTHSQTEKASKKNMYGKKAVTPSRSTAILRKNPNLFAF